jgi:hypothetical protein
MLYEKQKQKEYKKRVLLSERRMRRIQTLYYQTKARIQKYEKQVHNPALKKMERNLLQKKINQMKSILERVKKEYLSLYKK